MIETLLRTVCGNLKLLQMQAETELKTVEGDSNLADLQGFIDGVKDVFYEMPLSKYFPENPVKVEPADLTPDQLDRYVSAIGDWEGQRFSDERRNQKELIEKKKEYLFREAKKSRDLAYVTGWRHAVEYINEYFFQIEELYKNIAEENPLFYE
jgi:hypothetical protein